LRRHVLLLLGLLLLAGRSHAAETVDLALVLAVDVSSSIDDREFDLQRQGYAAAFRDPRLIATLQAGRTRRIAVAMMEWAGASAQLQVVPWTIVEDAASSRALGAAIAVAPRRVFDGKSTSISGAIDAGMRLLAQSGVAAERRVIDVSGDGQNNAGRPASLARDDAVAQGVTINGLAILSEDGLVGLHYRDHVIGGPGAFVIAVETFAEFADAILAKLVREVASAPQEFGKVASRNLRDLACTPLPARRRFAARVPPPQGGGSKGSESFLVLPPPLRGRVGEGGTREVHESSEPFTGHLC